MFPHITQGHITFLEPFPGVRNHLYYTQKLAETILALKLSVTTTTSKHEQILEKITHIFY